MTFQPDTSLRELTKAIDLNEITNVSSLENWVVLHSKSFGGKPYQQLDEGSQVFRFEEFLANEHRRLLDNADNLIDETLGNSLFAAVQRSELLQPSAKISLLRYFLSHDFANPNTRIRLEGSKKPILLRTFLTKAYRVPFPRPTLPSTTSPKVEPKVPLPPPPTGVAPPPPPTATTPPEELMELYPKAKKTLKYRTPPFLAQPQSRKQPRFNDPLTGVKRTREGTGTEKLLDNKKSRAASAPTDSKSPSSLVSKFDKIAVDHGNDLTDHLRALRG